MYAHMRMCMHMLHAHAHVHVPQALPCAPQVLAPSGLGKVSPHVMAFAPGATLLASLDTRMDGAAGAAGAADAAGAAATLGAAAATGREATAGAAVLASLSYVSSYENQGRLAVWCARGCRCAGL